MRYYTFAMQIASILAAVGCRNAIVEVGGRGGLSSAIIYAKCVGVLSQHDGLYQLGGEGNNTTASKNMRAAPARRLLT